MSRKRPRPGAEPLGLRRRRGAGPAEADPQGRGAGARGLGGGAPPGSPPRPGSARAAVAELGRLFPRGLFEDALPPIALRSQVYSLVPDRTAADRQLVRARRPDRTAGGRRGRGGSRPGTTRGASAKLGTRCRTFAASGTWLFLPDWRAAFLGLPLLPLVSRPMACQCY